MSDESYGLLGLKLPNTNRPKGWLQATLLPEGRHNRGPRREPWVAAKNNVEPLQGRHNAPMFWGTQRRNGCERTGRQRSVKAKGRTSVLPLLA